MNQVLDFVCDVLEHKTTQQDQYIITCARTSDLNDEDYDIYNYRVDTMDIVILGAWFEDMGELLLEESTQGLLVDVVPSMVT